MLTLLKDWQGTIEINGKEYTDARTAVKPSGGPVRIFLRPQQSTRQNAGSSTDISSVQAEGTVKITVKPYMTRPATPEFDFMAKWNNNVPMPIRTMIGTVEKETRGMVYMKLHGYGERTVNCLCCGKELTNKISRAYGIGPVCLSKMGITRDIEDVAGITEDLAKLEWEGWVIKSAIVLEEEV